MRIFQRSDGGDALLFGNSPKKPVKKISNGKILISTLLLMNYKEG